MGPSLGELEDMKTTSSAMGQRHNRMACESFYFPDPRRRVPRPCIHLSEVGVTLDIDQTRLSFSLYMWLRYLLAIRFSDECKERKITLAGRL